MVWPDMYAATPNRNMNPARHAYVHCDLSAAASVPARMSVEAPGRAHHRQQDEVLGGAALCHVTRPRAEVSRFIAEVIVIGISPKHTNVHGSALSIPGRESLD